MDKSGLGDRRAPNLGGAGRALLLLSLLAVVPSFPAEAELDDPDVLGVRPGMTPEQVTAVLAGSHVAGEARADRRTEHVTVSRFRSESVDDQVLVYFLESPAGGAPRVVVVERSRAYGNSGPVSSATRAALVQKYGQPDDDDGLVWFLDDPKPTKREFLRWRSHCAGNLVASVLTNNRLGVESGTCWKRVLQARIGARGEFVGRLTVVLADGVALRDGRAAWQASEEKRKAAERDENLRTAPPPPDL